MAATQMVPDQSEIRQRAARISRLRAEQGEDSPRALCEGKHQLSVIGYWRGPAPSGVDCQRPLRVVCANCDYQTVWSCSNHRERACKPCAGRYRRRVRALALAGLAGHPGGYFYFATCTASSFPHRMPSGDFCPCGVEDFDLAKWNASHSSRWNHLRTLLRRAHPGMEFFRAIEPQKRGALHDHVIVWSPSPIAVTELRRLAIQSGFGHSVDLQPAQRHSSQIPEYVSKYVTKGCDSREEIPWYGEIIDYDTGEVTEGLVDRAPYRTWSQSQAWGTTMSAVRAEAAQMALAYVSAEQAPLLALLAAQLGAEPRPDPDESPPLTG